MLKFMREERELTGMHMLESEPKEWLALPDSSVQREKVRAARPAFRIFFEEVFARERAMGKRPHVATAEFWKLVRDLWAELPAERRETYTNQAEAEKNESRA